MHNQDKNLSESTEVLIFFTNHTKHRDDISIIHTSQKENQNMGKPEGIIEDYLIKQAENNNCLCYKFTSPGKRGVPDRIVIGHGYTVFVECKSPTGTTRKQQDFRIKEMRDHGALVYVLNTKPAIDEFFEKLTKHKL